MPDGIERISGQLAGEGILLARVVGSQQSEGGPKPDFQTVLKAWPGRWNPPLPIVEDPEDMVVSVLAQCHDTAKPR